MTKFLYQSFWEGNKKFLTYLIGFLVMIGGNIIASIPLLVYGMSSGSITSDGEMNMQGVDKNRMLLLMLLPFVGMLAGMYLAQEKLHQRPFLTLITPNAKINWQKILFSFGLWFALNLIIQAVDCALEPDLVFQFNFIPFLLLCLISLLLIPLQTSLEELFFRGYCMQGIGNMTKIPLIPLLITAVSFGAMHLANPEVQAMGLGLSMSYYIGFGLILGAITLLDNSLELALGFHAANNIFASVFITFKSSALQTDALWIDPHLDFTRMFLLWLGAIAVYLIVIHKKYKLASIASLWKISERE